MQADTTLYAAYSRTVRKYTVTWRNSNGTVLKTDTNVPYGTLPNYSGAAPANPVSGGGAFTGWTPAIAEVTGDVAYTASYIPTYTATFVRASEDGGGTLYTVYNVPQGTTPVYVGDTPVSEQGADYVFERWDPAPSGMTKNTTYTAVFDYMGHIYKQLLNGKLRGEVSHESATRIGTRALYSFKNVTKFNFPEVTFVGEYAFSGCTNVTEIHLPKATSIGVRCFENLSKLTQLEIPKVSNLGEYAMYSCAKLESISLPELTVMPQYAFNYCRLLKTVHAPKLTQIGRDALSYCYALENIELPETLTVIGQYAFRYDTSLTKIVIPEAVQTVREYAFDGCTGLKKVVFMGTPASLYTNSFRECSGVTDVYVPWAYGAKPNAPWGMANATIHYAEEGWMEDIETILAD